MDRQLTRKISAEKFSEPLEVGHYWFGTEADFVVLDYLTETHEYLIRRYPHKLMRATSNN